MTLLHYLAARIFGSREIRMAKRLMAAAADRVARRPGADARVKVAMTALIAHVRSENFAVIKVGARDYVSRGGAFSICDDIFGLEVKMNKSLTAATYRGLLECSPGDYGLDWREGRALFDAVAEGWMRQACPRAAR